MNKLQAFSLKFQLSEYQRLMETAKRPDYLGEWAKELAGNAWSTFMSEYDEQPRNRHYARSFEWKLANWDKDSWMYFQEAS